SDSVNSPLRHTSTGKDPSDAEEISNHSNRNNSDHDSDDDDETAGYSQTTLVSNVESGQTLKPPKVLSDLRESLRQHSPPLETPPTEPYAACPLTDSQELSLQHYLAWNKTNGTVGAYNAHAAVLNKATGIEILSLFR
ncbi:hypothetical protein H0H81_004891, partial [Sphagnurus paluster]